MQYKEKLKSLINSLDTETRELGFKLLFGKINPTNAVYWYYQLKDVSSRRIIIPQELDAFFKETMKIEVNNSGTEYMLVATYMSNNMNAVSKECIAEHMRRWIVVMENMLLKKTGDTQTIEKLKSSYEFTGKDL